MIKKQICLILFFILLASALPSFADDGAGTVNYNVAPTAGAYIRNSQSNTALGGSILVVDPNPSAHRMSFIKFDFAKYMDSLEDIDSAMLMLASKDAKGESDYTVSILPDAQEEYVNSSLTYNIAAANGLVADTAGELLSTVMNPVNNEYTATDDIKEAVKKHLTEYTDNTTVAFKIYTTRSNPYVIYGIGSQYEPYISIVQTINIQSVVQKTFDTLTFDKISHDTEAAVTSNLNLIASGDYGTKIEWTSSDSTTVNPESGIINQPRKGEGAKSVILTAHIINGSYALSKEFALIVPEGTRLPDEMLQDGKIVYSAESTFIRKGSQYADVSYGNTDMVVDARASDGLHRMGFVRFDLTDYIDDIENADSMMLRLDTKGDCNVTDNNNFMIYMLPDSDFAIDVNTLTYNSAKSVGLVEYTENLIGVFPAPLSPMKQYYTNDILPQIKECLANSASTTIWFKAAASSGVGYSIYGAGTSENTKPALVLKYPKPPCQLDTILLKLPSVTDTDLTLPLTGEYGSTISWTSSDEAVIASDGKVFVEAADEDAEKEDKTVVLTATLTNGDDTMTKEFTVRVRRSGIIDASADTCVTQEENQSTLSYAQIGGTTGNIALISFDLGTEMDQVKNSRKIYLKLYSAEDAEGKTVQAVCIDNGLYKSSDISALSYAEATAIAESDNRYTLDSVFLQGKASFDITEYAHFSTENKLLFVIRTQGARLDIDTLEAQIGHEPKLLISPIAYTDNYGAQTAAADIEFSALSDENPNEIRKSLNLPKSGRFNTTITWECTEPSVIDTDTGSVTRGETDQTVTLMAIIQCGETILEKSFPIIVKKIETDAQYAAYLLDSLCLPTDILTADIVLPGNTLPDGATVTWSSSEPQEAAIDGFSLKVNRPYSKEVSLTLTAALSLRNERLTRDFAVTVVRSGDKNLIKNRNIISGDADAAKAIDEDTDTMWTVENTELILDLGSAKVISGFTFLPRSTIAGLTAYHSTDGRLWNDTFANKMLVANKLNYVTVDTAVYDRYIKFKFSSADCQMAFMAAYSTVSQENDADPFSLVTLPAEATADFELLQTIYGNPVIWKSSSSAIKIDAGMARVSRAKTSTSVTLTAAVTLGETKYTKSFVVYLPGTGSSFATSGGGKSSGGGSLYAPVKSDDAEPMQPLSKDKFTDLAAASWAKEYIYYLSERGIVNGTPEGKYAPNEPLKREEMAKIICLAFQLESTENTYLFKDVERLAWYSNYVDILAANSVTAGVGDECFGVGADISRQDAFTMLVKACNMAYTGSTEKTGFADENLIADYARKAILILQQKAIIGGDEHGNINPQGKITRAEMAKIVCLAMQAK